MLTAIATAQADAVPTELSLTLPTESDPHYRYRRVPPFRVDSTFRATATGHCCNTWEPVASTRGNECAHHHVLWNEQLDEAARRAGELR